MTQNTLTKADLSHFSGSEHWYRHWAVRKVVYTDGIQYVAEQGGAYWLIDEIAFAQADRRIAAQKFQVWKLRVNADHTGTLTCADGNYRVVHAKELEFTDFPLEEISFYFIDNVILLPSEY